MTRTYVRHLWPPSRPLPTFPGYTNPSARTYARHPLCLPNLPADTGMRRRRLMPTFAVVSGYQPSADAGTRRRRLLPTFAVVSAHLRCPPLLSVPLRLPRLFERDGEDRRDYSHPRRLFCPICLLAAIRMRRRGITPTFAVLSAAPRIRT